MRLVKTFSGAFEGHYDPEEKVFLCLETPYGFYIGKEASTIRPLLMFIFNAKHKGFGQYWGVLGYYQCTILKQREDIQ